MRVYPGHGQRQLKISHFVMKRMLPSIKFCKQYWIPTKFQQYLVECKILRKAQFFQNQISAIFIYTRKFFVKKVPMKEKSQFKQTVLYHQKKNWGKKSLIPHSYLRIGFLKQLHFIFIKGVYEFFSFTHQIYLRNWANSLSVSFLSVDYGKAPQYPYPSGLHDCFEVCMWAIIQFQQVFKAKLKKIIIVGDSAEKIQQQL